MEPNAIISLVVFLVVMALIISEKVNRTVAAVCGACIVVMVHILSDKAALGYIDFNTLGVLIGMMIIVGVVRTTGVFEYLAFYSAKKAKGDPWRILVSLCTVTAILSAFLDNVTTVLLIVPMTFVIVETLELDPILFLIPIVISSNIGGTATLIGDPPNIMIGSRAGLSFIDFLMNLTPIIIVVFIATMIAIKLRYRNKLNVEEAKKEQIMKLDAQGCITNHKLLRICVVVLIVVIAGLIFGSKLGYSTAIIALSGAALLLLLSRQNIDEAMSNVEWPTIFFFCGLFVIVGSLEEVGIIKAMAEFIMNLTDKNLLLTGILIIWFSAIFSAFLDNIPFVATLIPMIQAMGASGVDIMPLWWAVSLGACLGGNGTLIGASANVVVSGLAGKRGYNLSFARFTKTGFPLMLLSVALSTIYLVIFYLR